MTVGELNRALEPFFKVADQALKMRDLLKVAQDPATGGGAAEVRFDALGIPNGNWFVCVRAYNAGSLRSGCSNELTVYLAAGWLRPATLDRPPASDRVQAPQRPPTQNRPPWD